MDLDAFSEFFILIVEAYSVCLTLFNLSHYWSVFKVFLLEL